MQLLKLKQTFLFIKQNMEFIVDKKQKFTGAYLKQSSKIYQALSASMAVEALKDHVNDLIDEIDSMMERLDLEA